MILASKKVEIKSAALLWNVGSYKLVDDLLSARCDDVIGATGQTIDELQL